MTEEGLKEQAFLEKRQPTFATYRLEGREQGEG